MRETCWLCGKLITGKKVWIHFESSNVPVHKGCRALQHNLSPEGDWRGKPASKPYYKRDARYHIENNNL